MMEAVWQYICVHPEITVIGAITLIQVAPIKLDPWSIILAAARKLFLGDVADQVSDMSKKVNNISDKVDSLESQVNEDKALHARTHILRFADELYNGKHHSKEYFDDMLVDIDKYEQYCSAHPNFKNNKTVMSAKLIKDTYNQLLEEHKF